MLGFHPSRLGSFLLSMFIGAPFRGEKLKQDCADENKHENIVL